MPEPLEIEQDDADTCSNDSVDEEDEGETISMPLVGQNSSSPHEAFKHHNNCNHRMLNTGRTCTNGSKTCTQRGVLLGSNGARNRDNNDDSGGGGGLLSLFLCLGAAVVASLIMYNIKHLGEMEDTASDELQSLVTSHVNNSSNATLFVNDTTINHSG